MIEGLQNSSWMAKMDQILKQIGTEKAAEHFKVSTNFSRIDVVYIKLMWLAFDLSENFENAHVQRSEVLCVYFMKRFEARY